MICQGRVGLPLARPRSVKVCFHRAQNEFGNIYRGTCIQDAVTDDEIETGRLRIILHFLQKGSLQFAEFFIATKIQVLSEFSLQTSNFALQITKFFLGIAAFRFTHHAEITSYFSVKLFEFRLLGNNCPLTWCKLLL